ncbi:MAG: RluA family pseudouridine synthase [Opitutaceae bacterium]|nr:RluA family pseudouridine synthase [Opitutaceae bacterium]
MTGGIGLDSVRSVLDDPLKIVFEDSDLLAVDKPRGLLVEGFEGGERSLENLVREYAGARARALHRLDRDTTGVVLFAKNSKWNRALSELFEKKRIRKEYWAIVRGSWDKRINRIDTRICRQENGRWGNSKTEGKAALTTFRLLGQGGEFSWVQALPKTGRTHQIRLHCLAAGCPIVGDRFYSDDDSNPLLLHARSLSFPHPDGGREVRLNSEPPGNWSKWLSIFEK